MWKFLKRKKKDKEQEPKLCSCTGDIRIEKEWSGDHISLVDGSHTACMFMTCAKCGGWTGFPDFNFRLGITSMSDSEAKLFEDAGIPIFALRKQLKVAI